MPHSDASRWNLKYRDQRYSTFKDPRPFLTQNAHYLPSRGLALDAAMGLGGNGAFLIQRGIDVIGVDISDEAVVYAKKENPELMAVIADLNRFYLPPGSLDIILNFYYLNRELWPAYEEALRPGGLLIFESLTEKTLSINPSMDPNYLLHSGELRDSFPGLEILAYKEGETTGRRGHRRFTAALIGRKP